MTDNEIKALEVRAKNDGWYWCTIFVYNKWGSEDPEYVREWFESTDGKWDYDNWLGRAYVCFIHDKK